MMDQKTINKFILYIGIIMIFFPILINYLMFIKILPVSGDEKTWISSLGTFWGAILGGVVSGTLTLIGVQISVNASFKGIEKTIKHQENTSFKENIGIKLNKLYYVKSIIFKTNSLLSNRSYGWNENFEKDEMKNIDDNILRYLLPNLNVLLELSSAVDWEFYNEIRKFVEDARKCIFINEPDFKNLTNIVDKLTEKIECEHETRLSNKFKEVSNV